MSADPSHNRAMRFTFDIQLSAAVCHQVQPAPLSRPNVFLHRPRIVIGFRSIREGGRSNGVQLAELFLPPSEFPTVSDAQDIVLHGLGGPRRELKFIINWPGYAHEQTTISTISVNGGPLTRIELGRSIMMAYVNFFRKVAQERILPAWHGPYDIALHQAPQVGPDPKAVQLSNLRLVSFQEPIPGTDDHWFAQIDIVQV